MKIALILFLSTCLLEAKPVFRTVRKPLSVTKTQRGSERNIKIGGRLGFDGLMGKTANSDTSSKGLGYSIGLSAEMKVIDKLKILFSPSYNYMRLGKTFDGSGQLQEPTPVNVDQSVKSIGLALMGGYLLEPGSDEGSPAWWLDLGGQYLMPLSAQQSINGSSNAFTAPKGFLLLLGTSAEFKLNETYGLDVSLHGFYNLAGSSDGRYYGIRLLAGMTMSI